MRRVVQFSTGNVGQHSLKAIIGRPDLELVGVHAASPNKIGRDAAELCGLTEPTGIIATDDVDALIALKPDCVVYTAQAETRPMEALEQLSKLLAAGINVVGSSMVWLVTPRQADDWLLGPLEKACEAGQLVAVCERHRPRLLRRHRGAQRARVWSPVPSRSSCRRSSTTPTTTTSSSPASQWVSVSQQMKSSRCSSCREC